MAPFPLFGLRSDHDANGGTRLGLRNSNPSLWKNFVRSENHGLTSESCGLMSSLCPHHRQHQLLINSSNTSIFSNPNLRLSQNTQHLFSHASSSYHLGQPLALGQKPATTSRHHHLPTVIDLDPEEPTPPAAAASPIVIDLDPEEPAAPAPAAAAAAWPLVLGGNNQNHHGGVSTFMTHEVIRTHLLSATLNAEGFLGHQYHNHAQIQDPRANSRNPNKTAHHNNVASTSRALSGTFPQKFKAPKYIQIFGHTFFPTRAQRDKEAIKGQPISSLYSPPPKNGRNPKSQLRGPKSHANGKPKLRYRRVYSLKHSKYGPYTCSECFGISRTSPLFASHVSSRHPIKYRLIFSDVEDGSNVSYYLGPRPRKSRNKSATKSLAKAGPSKNKKKKSGGVDPKGKNIIDRDVGPTEGAAPDVIMSPQFDLNYSHETIREKKRRARHIHVIASSEGACADPAGPSGSGGPEVAGPSGSGGPEVAGPSGSGGQEMAGPSGSGGAEIEVPVKIVG